jgi:hypothetical protein
VWRAVGLAVAVGVLQHDDAIAFGLTGVMRAVANAFGHPDAAVAIDVDVGRVEELWRGRPDGHFHAVRHLEELDGQLDRLAGPGLPGSALRRCGCPACAACGPYAWSGTTATSIITSTMVSGETRYRRDRRINLSAMIDFLIRPPPAWAAALRVAVRAP